jgi:hypothetical protein
MYLFDQNENALASPRAWVDGKDMGANPLDWATQMNTDVAVPAEASIKLEQEEVGGAIQLKIKVKGLATGKYNDLSLHTVITEGEINYNDGNDEFVHFEVMRTMLPDANGEPITIANGAERTFTRSITLEPTWVKANLKAVVFIQSTTSKAILQSARIALK